LRIHGLPLRWTSEIEAWEPPYRFSDRQIRGPYRSWLHEHTFHEVEGGTLVGDRVDFELPGGRLLAGPIGRLAGRVVATDVRRIFDFRRERMGELFG